MSVAEEIKSGQAHKVACSTGYGCMKEAAGASKKGEKAQECRCGISAWTDVAAGDESEECGD